MADLRIYSQTLKLLCLIPCLRASYSSVIPIAFFCVTLLSFQKQHCLSPSFAANKEKQLQQNYDLLLNQTSDANSPHNYAETAPPRYTVALKPGGPCVPWCWWCCKGCGPGGARVVGCAVKPCVPACYYSAIPMAATFSFCHLCASE